MDFEELKTRLKLPANEPESHWHRHENSMPNGTKQAGGWVQNTASVAPTAFVGEEAIVSGYAEVANFAVIAHQAQVSDYAVVGGRAQVFHTAQVCGRAVVRDNAKVYDTAQVGDNALVGDYACVSKNAKVGGRTRVEGTTHVTSDRADPWDTHAFRERLKRGRRAGKDSERGV